MKTTILCLILLTNTLFAQNWDWVQTIRPGGNEYCWDVTCDPAGNVIGTGRVKGFSTFGSGAFIQNPPPKSTDETDVFVAKYRPNGDLVWAKRDGGTEADWGRALCSDLNGNIFVIGDFSDTAYFGAQQVVGVGSESNRNIFFAKYDSTGTCLWAKAAGNAANASRGYGVCTDAAGNSYITGHISGVSSFDGITFGVAGYNVPFIAKFSPAGICQWVKRVSVGISGEGNDIRMDVYGNLLVAGSYRGTMIVNGISHPSSGTSWTDVFLIKMDQSGNFIWARSATGAYQDIANSVDADSLGNIYLAGTFANDLTFGTTTINSAGWGSSATTAHAGIDAFVAKYDKNGNFKWVKTIANSYDVSLDEIIVRNNNKVLVGGFVRGPHNIFGTTVVSDSSAIAYVTAIDSLGGIIWNEQNHEVGTTAVHRGIAFDHHGNVFAGGEFIGDPFISFDSVNFQSMGAIDAHVAKLYPPLQPEVRSDKNSFCISDSVQFTLFQDGYPLAYQWNFPGGSPAVSTARNPKVFYSSPGTYNVQLQVFNGHVASTVSLSSYINVYAAPLLSLGADTSICSNEPLVLNPGAFASYSWSDMSTAPSFVVNSAGTYYVTVGDINDCSSSDTISVSINSAPVVDLGGDTIICSGQTVTLDAGAGFAEYLWSDGSAMQTLDVSTSGSFYVTVSDLNGCSDTDTIISTVDLCTGIDDLSAAGVLVYPNPASDNMIIRIGAPLSSDVKLQVFDNRGRVVIERMIGPRSDISVADLESGIYMYRLSSDAFNASGRIVVIH
jgi:PKD repeat protein